MQKRLTPYLWILPVIIIIGILIIYPLIWTLIISFQTKLIGSVGTFCGFDNYINILKSREFLDSLWKSLYFTVPSIIFKFLLGLGSALVLNHDFKGRNIIRSWLFIPWTIPRFAVAIMFIWIFRTNGGLDLMLSKIGFLNTPFWLGPKLVMPTMIFINVWKGFPFFMVGILSALQTIPREIYEAATIDGAGKIQLFRFITFPLIKNATLIVTTLSTIWTITEFDVIFLMTGGGPGVLTQTLPILTYVKAFRKYNLGEAAAIAMLSLPILLALILWIVNLTQKGEQ